VGELGRKSKGSQERVGKECEACKDGKRVSREKAQALAILVVPWGGQGKKSKKKKGDEVREPKKGD